MSPRGNKKVYIIKKWNSKKKDPLDSDSDRQNYHKGSAIGMRIRKKNKEKIMTLKRQIREGKLPEEMVKKLDFDRLDEEKEDFLKFSRNKALAYNTEQLKPKYEMKRNEFSSPGSSIQDQFKMLKRTYVGSETVYNEGRAIKLKKIEQSSAAKKKPTKRKFGGGNADNQSTVSRMKLMIGKKKKRDSSILKDSYMESEFGISLSNKSDDNILNINSENTAKKVIVHQASYDEDFKGYEVVDPHDQHDKRIIKKYMKNSERLNDKNLDKLLGQITCRSNERHIEFS